MLKNECCVLVDIKLICLLVCFMHFFATFTVQEGFEDLHLNETRMDKKTQTDVHMTMNVSKISSPHFTMPDCAQKGNGM